MTICSASATGDELDPYPGARASLPVLFFLYKFFSFILFTLKTKLQCIKNKNSWKYCHPV